ncbi:SDR family NAD(P)-dependent oxidoreductase [Streptomyces sp. NPDC059679]|uniref:SDR family NAD(P)-dependent oxidoreductase n=1 Tax=Streptomyces sp. NPDC059679 TaxID=3346903 RepID=UPI00367BF4B7
MPETPVTSHVAIVTGANQGIGAATAKELAARGVAVLCTCLRLRDADTADRYHRERAADCTEVVEEIRRAGGAGRGIRGGPRRP